MLRVSVLRVSVNCVRACVWVGVYVYICCFITTVQMSTAGIFWSRNLCLSIILLLRRKFRVNQKINRPDIAEKRFSLWRPSAILTLQNCGILSRDPPWKRNLRLHTKLR